ncbi:PREDICTED: odorant receptor 13a-like [Wasmannia auropunctata]|uniref:odorant receptor 13a-like n=1 Tax=Wasmannia auropunctata TaxID=64793 RepID=UPI0005EF848A|nr:PREDICTED: odorant receptor 13a-like [Wasmannia auropunctata]
MEALFWESNPNPRDQSPSGFHASFTHKIDERMLGNERYNDDMIYITKLTRNILGLLGIWPSYNTSKSTGDKARKYLLIAISNILLYCVLMPGVFFWIIEKRTRVRVQTIPLLIFVFMACSKYSNLIFRESNIKRCLQHIEEDYRFVTCANARNMMLESAKVGRRLVTLCAIFMYSSGLSFRLVLPFAKGKIITAQNVTIRPLPSPAYFIFFDVQVSPTYELIFAIQVLSGMITYSITTGLCGLATLFVMHACGQLKILVNLMRNLVEEQWQEKQEVDRKLARMVEHQIRIRSFLELVENTLQQACLIELMGATMIVCLLGYFIIMEWHNSNTIAMCSYFSSIASMMINMFMFCYTGEQLTVQAEKVARTSCMLEWYRLPNKEARGIVLVVIMSNLPTRITAGKLMDLSLKTYGDVVKSAVTYFNMLLKVAD